MELFFVLCVVFHWQMSRILRWYELWLPSVVHGGTVSTETYDKHIFSQIDVDHTLEVWQV